LSHNPTGRLRIQARSCSICSRHSPAARFGPRAAPIRGIETELRQRLAHRDSLAVLGPSTLSSKVPQRRGCQAGRCEPNAFLVGKAHPSMARCNLARACAWLQRRKSRDSPTAPSHLPARHRVVMRPQHEAGQAWTISFVTPQTFSIARGAPHPCLRIHDNNNRPRGGVR